MFSNHEEKYIENEKEYEEKYPECHFVHFEEALHAIQSDSGVVKIIRSDGLSLNKRKLGSVLHQLRDPKKNRPSHSRLKGCWMVPDDFIFPGVSYERTIKNVKMNTNLSKKMPVSLLPDDAQMILFRGGLIGLLFNLKEIKKQYEKLGKNINKYVFLKNASTDSQQLDSYRNKWKRFKNFGRQETTIEALIEQNQDARSRDIILDWNELLLGLSKEALCGVFAKEDSIEARLQALYVKSLILKHIKVNEKKLNLPILIFGPGIPIKMYARQQQAEDSLYMGTLIALENRKIIHFLIENDPIENYLKDRLKHAIENCDEKMLLNFPNNKDKAYFYARLQKFFPKIEVNVNNIIFFAEFERWDAVFAYLKEHDVNHKILNRLLMAALEQARFEHFEKMHSICFIEENFKLDNLDVCWSLILKMQDVRYFLKLFEKGISLEDFKKMPYLINFLNAKLLEEIFKKNFPFKKDFFEQVLNKLTDIELIKPIIQYVYEQNYVFDLKKPYTRMMKDFIDQHCINGFIQKIEEKIDFDKNEVIFYAADKNKWRFVDVCLENFVIDNKILKKLLNLADRTRSDFEYISCIIKKEGFCHADEEKKENISKENLSKKIMNWHNKYKKNYSSRSRVLLKRTEYAEILSFEQRQKIFFSICKKLEEDNKKHKTLEKYCKIMIDQAIRLREFIDVIKFIDKIYQFDQERNVYWTQPTREPGIYCWKKKPISRDFHFIILYTKNRLFETIKNNASFLDVLKENNQYEIVSDFLRQSTYFVTPGLFKPKLPALPIQSSILLQNQLRFL